MSKWLLALLLFALPVLAQVDVQYEGATVSLDQDVYRTRSMMAMSSSGSVWIFVAPAATFYTITGIWFENWGTTYQDTTPIITYSAGRQPRMDIHGIGDTIIFACEPAANTDNPPYWGMVIADVFSADTVVGIANYGTFAGRPGAGMVGTRPLSVNVLNVVTDSSFVFTADAIPVAGDFRSTVIDQPYLAGDGWRTPLYYNDLGWGVLLYEAGLGANLVVADTFGFTEVNGSMFPAIGMFQSYMFVMLDDSNGVAIYQEDDVAGQDSVVAFTFKIRGTGTASPTFAAGADSTILLSHANVPDGYNSSPNLQHLVGTDSVFAFYRYWDDTANYDSVDIAYKVSADKGATWGAQQISRAAVNGDPIFNLQTHETNYRDGSGNLLAYLVHTPQVATDDSLWIYIDTLEAGSVAPARQRVIIIQ